MTQYAQRRVEALLERADIKIGGDRSWDVTVHNQAVFGAVLRHGSLGLGEAYVAGWWDTEALDQCFVRLLRAGLEQHIKRNPALIYTNVMNLLTNRQRVSRAFEIGERHYDIGNDVYRAMLDDRLTYTCGYWRGANTLLEAQEAKLDFVCRKLGLQKGMTVLDIGCGWGSFAKFAAEKYGVRVTGITVSKQQVELGTKLCQGLPVDIRLQDYRDVSGTFDRVVSLGMFEHVGYKNYRTYMEISRRLLKPDGIFLLHTIGSNVSRISGDPWIDAYIFPAGVLPSIAQIGRAIEDVFVMEDWHSFGADYDKTLMAWFENFHAAWPQLKNKYNKRFYRMWKYYLLTCAASFRVRRIQLWQIILSPRGIPGGYTSVR